MNASGLAFGRVLPVGICGDQVELPGRAISPEDYRGTLLNRQNDTPLDGLEELIVALHDIGEVLQRPAVTRLARIARAAG